MLDRLPMRLQGGRVDNDIVKGLGWPGGEGQWYKGVVERGHGVRFEESELG